MGIKGKEHLFHMAGVTARGPGTHAKLTVVWEAAASSYGNLQLSYVSMGVTLSPVGGESTSLSPLPRHIS